MKLGVVGTSEIVETFMQAVSYFPTLELKAVMSPRQSSIERFINKYGFEKGFTDFDELITNTDIDLLYIASPNSFHFLQTKKALQKRINVLCEKPITLSLNELEILEEIASQHVVFFMEAMRLVHHPRVGVLKEAISQLDGLHYANFTFMRYSSKYDAYKLGQLARVCSKEFGGGALNDLGVYPITLAVLLFGIPKNVTADAVKIASGVDVISNVSLNYENFICNCTCSKVSTSYAVNEIQGEKKALLLSHITRLDKLVLVDGKEEKIIFDDFIEDDMRFQIKTFMEIINTKNYLNYQKFLSYSKVVTKICDEVRQIIREMGC